MAGQPFKILRHQPDKKNVINPWFQKSITYQCDLRMRIYHLEGKVYIITYTLPRIRTTCTKILCLAELSQSY